MSRSAGAQALGGVDETVLLCRYKRHAWSHDGFYRDGPRGVISAFTCRDCGAEREQSLGARTEVIENRYSYPAGYLLPKGTGGVRPVDVRREMLARYPVQRADAR